MTRKISLIIASILAVTCAVAAELPDPGRMQFAPMEFHGVQPERKTLRNGAELWLMEDHSLPLITIFANIGVGSESDPGDKFGVAEMTANMLTRGGTATMTADAMEAYIDRYALTLKSQSSPNLTTVEMSCLARDFDTVLPFFMEILQKPRFEESRMDVIRSALAADIRQRMDFPFFEAFHQFNRLVYGDNHPKARMPSETVLATITRDDLRAFHQTYYHPDIVKIGVAGDFSAKSMKRRLKKAFGNWKGRAADKIESIPPAPTGQGHHVYIMPREGSQAAIVMGHPGLPPNNPDKYSLEIFSKILGMGGFSSRLMNEVRTRHGLAYSVFGGFMDDLPAGIFAIACMTKIATAGDAVQLSLDVVKDMRTNPVTDEELARFRDIIENAYVFKFENPKWVLKRMLYYQQLGFPADYLETYLANIQAVTPEMIVAAAKKDVHPESIFVVAVGPEQELRDAFSTLNWPVDVIRDAE